MWDTGYRINCGIYQDTVLTAYSEWLVGQRAEGWRVADLHAEMLAKIDRVQAQDPKFTVQKDRVHPNPAGHWMMAQALISYFGDSVSAQLATTDELIDISDEIDTTVHLETDSLSGLCSLTRGPRVSGERQNERIVTGSFISSEKDAEP